MKKHSEFRQTLSAFRDSVTEWSETKNPGLTGDFEFLKYKNSKTPVRPGFFPLRWAFVGALGGILIVLPFYRSAVEREREAKELEDVVLLEQVNAYLSRSIPATMEPFAEVVSDDGDLIEDVQGDHQ